MRGCPIEKICEGFLIEKTCEGVLVRRYMRMSR